MKIKFFLALSLFSTASFSMTEPNPSFEETTPGEYTSFHGKIVNNNLWLYDSNTWISYDSEPIDLGTSVNEKDFRSQHSAKEVCDSLAACLSMKFQLEETASGDKPGNFFIDSQLCNYSTVLNAWKKNPLMVLSISDPHCTGHKPRDYDAQKYIQYTNAVEKLIADYNGVVLLMICGDAAPKGSNSSLKFADTNFIDFVKNLTTILQNKNERSQVIYVFGNHDLQDKPQFCDFVREAKQAKINILTNIPSLWQYDRSLLDPACDDAFSEDLNPVDVDLDKVAYINGSVAVVPYGLNFTFGGGGFSMLAEAQNPTDMILSLNDIYRDKHRNGVPDMLFGSPLANADCEPKEEQILFADSCKGQIDFSTAIAALGDRSVLNSAAEQTADIFFDQILNAAQNSPNGPITVIVAAHDYYLRPAIFYEMMSRFVKKYRLPPEILQRLRIIIAGAHEHSKYAGAGNCYLMGADKRIYQIPCSFGGAGIFLQAINVFSIPQCTIDTGAYISWLEAPKYSRYCDWVDQWRAKHEKFCEFDGGDLNRPRSFYGTGYDGENPGQDYTLKGNFTDQNFLFTVSEYANLPQIVETSDGQLIMQTFESNQDCHDGDPIFELANGTFIDQDGKVISAASARGEDDNNNNDDDLIEFDPVPPATQIQHAVPQQPSVPAAIHQPAAANQRIHGQPVANPQQPPVPIAAPQQAQSNAATQNGNFVTRHPWVTVAATTAICVALGTLAYRRWFRK